MRKWGLMVLLTWCSFAVSGQVQREDGTWFDDQLTFHVENELIRQYGELTVCVWHNANEMCIENLMTAYEILVYNAQDEEIYTSLWTGRVPDVVFKKPLPEAKYIIIRAQRDFVINVLTGTRIYTGEPLELKYDVR